MEKWFLMEPPLFQVLSIHELTPNTRMKCPLRSGKRKLEYNPNLISKFTLLRLEQALKVEAIRILLKHPYQRKPFNCSNISAALASNLVIGDNYSYPGLEIETPIDFGLEEGMNYEWYAVQLENLQSNNGNGKMDKSSTSDREDNAEDNEDDNAENDKENNTGSDENGERYSNLAGLWDEDDFTSLEINSIIARTEQWGSLAGNLRMLLKNSLKAKINWRNILAGFRASIISSKRKLTRMKPNRRTGFDNMGSTLQYDSRLLVAVDVSGSVTLNDLQYFYGVINSAFKYGFQAIDTIQFDYGIRQVQTLKKTSREVALTGGGGTSFQEPVDYAHKMNYDGLVILTDGFAPAPVIPEGFRTKILWVLDNEKNYNTNCQKLKLSGRVCTMQI
ncbi:MAG: hypothetical protein IJ476_06325 [Bacteroidales bacterium]|nr:hypothetical protein [Bacteroidales bacterium]